MCYGVCPLEKASTGECRGARDWNSPESACSHKDGPEVKMVMIDKRLPISGLLYTRVLEAEKNKNL